MGNEYSDQDKSSLRRLRLAIRNLHSDSGRANNRNPFLETLLRKGANIKQSVADQPIGTPQLAAYVGIDWADQKHDVILRSVDNPAKAEHQVIKSELNALNDWIAQMHERFGAKGKVLVCLEQSRGALIYQLMAYELFSLSDQIPANWLIIVKPSSVAAPRMMGPTPIC